MRTWKRNPNEIQQLVEAFYTNDPYYPRPNPDDLLYKEFSNDYLSAHPEESEDVGEAFCVRSRTSTADVFLRIEFRYNSQVSTKVDSYPFVVALTIPLSLSSCKPFLLNSIRPLVLCYLSFNSTCFPVLCIQVIGWARYFGKVTSKNGSCKKI